MSSKSILTNVVSLTTAQIICKIVNFFWIVSLANYLGKTMFGKFSFAFSFSMILGFFINLGIDKIIVREISKDKEKAGGYLINALFLKVFSSLIVTIFMSLIIFANSYLFNNLLYLYLAFLIMIISSFEGILESYFTAIEKMSIVAMMQIVTTILIVTVGYYYIHHQYGLIEILLAYVFSYFIVLGTVLTILIVKFKIKFPRINSGECKRLLKESIPLAAVSIMVVIYYRIDFVMLGFLKGNEAVGIYSTAYRLFEAFLIFATVLLTASFPKLSQSLNDSIDKFKTYFNFMIKLLITIICPIVLVNLIYGKEIFNLLFSQEYIESIKLYRILIIALLFMYMNGLFYHGFISANKQNILPWISLSAVAINIILNLLLIPPLGAGGAAIATVTAEFTVWVLSLYFFNRYFDRYFGKIKVEKLILKLFLPGAIYFYLSILLEVNWIISIFLFLGIYLFSVIFLKIYSEREKAFIKAIFAKE